MAIRVAGESVRLDTFIGKLIGLRYLGSDVTTQTEWGERTAARASVVDLEDGKSRGSTLVFQEAIANELRNQGSDWVVGTLKKVPHPNGKRGHKLFVLDADGLDMEAVEAGFESAGIDPEA